MSVNLALYIRDRVTFTIRPRAAPAPTRFIVTPPQHALRVGDGGYIRIANQTDFDGVAIFPQRVLPPGSEDKLPVGSKGEVEQLIAPDPPVPDGYEFEITIIVDGERVPAGSDPRVKIYGG